MIEEIDIKNSLFDITRPEGTIIKRNNSYWMYVIDFEGCESCGREEEHKGWNNVTNVIMEAKKEVFDDFKRTGHWDIQNKVQVVYFPCNTYNELEKRHLSTFSKKKKKLN